MNILAFETSCDETSAAIIQDGRRILTNVVASQIELHKRWGGVVPELASRQHILYIVPTLEAALKEANLTWRDIDAIAVTNGPGLAGALLVGVNVAKGLAFALGKPLLPVNHIEGHIYANWLIPNPAAKPKPVVTDLPASNAAEQPPTTDEQLSARQYRAAYEQSAPVYRPAGASPPPQPSPKMGGGIVGERPPKIGEGIVGEPSPKIGEGVNAPQPSATSGEGVNAPQPSATSGEGVNAPQPSATSGERVVAPPEPQFPLVALVVSGGHTELILMRGHGQYELLGKTIDDAAGEAFDKVGRILGLGYPGGPAIQKLVDAEPADPHKIDLPRAWLRGTYDFSFSGLKTAVMRKIDEYGGLPPVEKPRPFAEVEAEAQRNAAQQRAANGDRDGVRPGQAPTAMVSEPLTMPTAPAQPKAEPPRGFQPPARLVRPAEPVAQPAEPPPPARPAADAAQPAPAVTPPAPPAPVVAPPRAMRLRPSAPEIEVDEDEDEEEPTPEPSFRLGPQQPHDRPASLFVRDADEAAEDETDEKEDGEGEDSGAEAGDTRPVPDTVGASGAHPAPGSPALERRPLLAEPPASRPHALYSMFDDEDEVATTTPATSPNPPRVVTTGPGLERRPLRTIPTPNLRAVPQPAADDEDEDEEDDEQPLPRTLSPQGRAMQRAAADQRAQPQPPAQQRPSQPPASGQQRGSVFPRSTVLGSEQPPQQPASSPPQRSQPPTPQRPTQQSPPQRPVQPRPTQSPTQRPTQQPSASPPSSPAPATAQPPLNRPRPLPPSRPQRGSYVRPGQLPPRRAPLAEREITPVPKGGGADDDDRDARDYIDEEDDDTPRSRVGSATDDEDEPGADDQPRRSNRSLGADAPRPQGVRGKVAGGDSSASKGHTPVALIAAAFQLAVVEVLVEKTAAAAEQYDARQVLLAGGVAANRLLREMMEERLDVPLLYPPPALCTDNAAMIGAAAYYRYYHAQGAGRERADSADWTMDIEPNAHFLGEV